MPTHSRLNGNGKKRWRGQVKRNGKTKTKWFGPGKRGGEEYRKAILWEEQRRQEMEEAEQASLKIAMASLSDWAQAYLDHVQAVQSYKTYAEKRKAFKALFQRVRSKLNQPVTVITRQLAMDHLREQNRKRTGYAANKDRKNLAAAWKWGRRFIPGFPLNSESPNPFRDIPKFPEKKLGRYVPPEGDFWRVLNMLEGQDRVMLLTFLHLGARRGEVFRLRWAEDVCFEKGREGVRVMTRKTRDGSEKYHWLPMTGELKRELLWWWENRPLKQAEHVFVNLADNQFNGQAFKHRSKFMAVACAKAGVKRFGYHAIRHLSATILFRSGVKLYKIQRILRHESPSTTERYLRSLGLDTDLENAVKVFEGRGPAKVIPFAKNAAAGGI